MILTTTSTIQGLEVREYLGVVNGEAILGANVFRDMFAGIRDIVGGRAGSYEKSLRNARETAIQEMIDDAARLGANAVIGIDIDYDSINISGGGNMLMVTASGSAVVVG